MLHFCTDIDSKGPLWVLTRGDFVACARIQAVHDRLQLPFQGVCRAADCAQTILQDDLRGPAREVDLAGETLVLVQTFARAQSRRDDLFDFGGQRAIQTMFPVVEEPETALGGVKSVMRVMANQDRLRAVLDVSVVSDIDEDVVVGIRDPSSPWSMKTLKLILEVSISSFCASFYAVTTFIRP